MEGRMTVCNMSIEMGARGGMIAPDETTFAYINGREQEITEITRNSWVRKKTPFPPGPGAFGDS